MTVFGWSNPPYRHVTVPELANLQRGPYVGLVKCYAELLEGSLVIGDMYTGQRWFAWSSTGFCMTLTQVKPHALVNLRCF